MLDLNKSTKFNKKSHFKAFVYVSYDTIRFVWYDTIHTIHILYRMIHEHLWYADTIRNFFHMIRYVSLIVWYWQLWVKALLSVVEQVEGVWMERRVHLSLPATEGIPLSATHYVKTRGGRGFVCLHCCRLLCGELGAGIGW